MNISNFKFPPLQLFTKPLEEKPVPQTQQVTLRALDNDEPLYVYWISLRRGQASWGILTDCSELLSTDELLNQFAEQIKRETGRPLSDWTAFVVSLGVLPANTEVCVPEEIWDEVHPHARWGEHFGLRLTGTDQSIVHVAVRGSEPHRAARFPTPRPGCPCSLCEKFRTFWQATDEVVVSGEEPQARGRTTSATEQPNLQPLATMGERYQPGPRQLFWINLQKDNQSWGILTDWPCTPEPESILQIFRTTIEKRTEFKMEELTAFLVDLGTLPEDAKVCASKDVFDSVHPHHDWSGFGYMLTRTDQPVDLFAKAGKIPDRAGFYPTPKPRCNCSLCYQLWTFWQRTDPRQVSGNRYQKQPSVSVSIQSLQEPQEQENDMTAVSINAPAPTEITRRGDQLILPEGMTYKDAIDLIQRRATYEEKETVIIEQLDAFPLDGAHALNVVLTQMYGWVEGVPTPGFFGDNPPVMIAVQTDIDRKINVPWGDIRLPNVKGVLTVGAQRKDGRFVSVLSAKIRRGDEPIVRSIFAKVATYLQTNSIYQGKAIAVRFFDNEGDPLPLPEPTFMDTRIDEESLIFSADMESMVRVNLLTPIERHKDLVANGIPLKRGVLLAGTYGTGKTLSAKLASKMAVEAGITFVYVRHAKELAHTIQFARAYSNPAVVIFCEDIDSVTDGKRDADLNDILNTIDGVDTKGMNLITLLTTNHIDRITTAMLRPGRLDAVIMVGPPDQAARVKLIRYYGGSAIAKDADLDAVASELDGAIPAVIAEVVKRAKLHQLALQKPGTPILKLTTDALLGSARTMIHQRKLLETAEERDREQHNRIRAERNPLPV